MRVSCIEAAGMSAIASGSSRHCTRQMALSGVIQAERRIPIAQVRQGVRVRLYHQSLSVRIAEHASISNKRLYTSIDDLKPGANVLLAGWLIQIRPVSKYLAFAVLLLPRGKGQVQLIIRNENETTVADVTDVWQAAGLHGVIEVEGVFSQRPESAQKNQDPFSRYELQVERCTLINAVTTSGLPFNPTDVGRSTKEEVRLRNRHLDLRNPERGDRIRLRSRVTWAIRSFLHANQFDEIETPTLLRSTPEGAREYLVPTRLSTSKVNKTDVDDPSTSDAQPKFFALQQSPQQPKQLLVISGVTDRYFQIARCFRDEDGRKDRQPEFTQVDMEMSFVSGEADPRHADWTLGGREVGNQVEGLIRAVWQSAGLQGTMTDAPFRVMTYEQAMTRFGSDKPDLRFDAEIVQVGQHLRAASEASGLEGEDAEQQEVDLLYFTLPDAGLTKKDVEAIVSQHAPLETEVFWGQREAENEMTKLLLRKSSLLRTFLNAHEIQASDVSVDKLKGFLSDAAMRGLPAADVDAYKPGDRTCVVLSSRQARSQGGSTVVGDVRRALLNELMARRLLKSSTPFQFAWIIEFPLFTRADEDKNVLSKGRWNSSHHPFTSPKSEDVKRMKDILRDHQAGTPFSQHDQHFLSNVKGQHYDLVLNGMEIGGGSVRIHDAELQRNVLRNVLELNEGELSRFDHLLRALQHGAPPHAGIALGLDRLMAVISDAPTIRDVIAFPKSAQGTDLLFGSPDAISSPSDDDGFAKATSTDEVLQRYGLRRA